MKFISFLNVLAVLVFCVPLQAQEDDYLLYAFPENAKRIGPGNARDPEINFYTYFRPDKTPSTESRIGKETYYNWKLIKRELYNGNGETLHGVQREWYPDGTLKSEVPYKNGVMQGVFRHWNEAGQLTGESRIEGGKGTQKIYNDQGELIFEKSIENSKGNGLWMRVFEETDNWRSLIWQKNDAYIGKSFIFYADDNIRNITCNAPLGSSGLEGPCIEFSESGAVTEKQWFLKGSEVKEAEYAAAAAADSSLPPYYEDASRYKEFVDEDVKALLEKYRLMPRVKIPLEFDSEGNPIFVQ